MYVHNFLNKTNGQSRRKKINNDKYFETGGVQSKATKLRLAIRLAFKLGGNCEGSPHVCVYLAKIAKEYCIHTKDGAGISLADAEVQNIKN
jgi:hypothetical protein